MMIPIVLNLEEFLFFVYLFKKKKRTEERAGDEHLAILCHQHGRVTLAKVLSCLALSGK